MPREKPEVISARFDQSTREATVFLHKECDLKYWTSSGLEISGRPWNDVGHFIAELDHAIGDGARWSREFEKKLHEEPAGQAD